MKQADREVFYFDSCGALARLRVFMFSMAREVSLWSGLVGHIEGPLRASWVLLWIVCPILGLAVLCFKATGALRLACWALGEVRPGWRRAFAAVAPALVVGYGFCPGPLVLVPFYWRWGAGFRAEFVPLMVAAGVCWVINSVVIAGIYRVTLVGLTYRRAFRLVWVSRAIFAVFATLSGALGLLAWRACFGPA